MTFLPGEKNLSLEEIELFELAFVELGVDKICLTNGAPFVRKGIDSLVEKLSVLLGLNRLNIS